ncbi:MAG: hypothetical protein K8S55_15000 [Phycisphaerae bacterium]|nr:hypothetical protein [Phycisphaerae bacterium]
MSIIVLAVLTSLGVAMSHMSVNEFRKADNHSNMTQARVSAESGLNYMMYQLSNVSLPGSTDESTFAANLCNVLPSSWEATGSGSTVNIPEIQAGDCMFACSISMISANRVKLESTGRWDTTTRRTSMEFDLTPSSSGIFDYGIATKGPLSLHGHVTIEGVDDPASGSVMSAANQVYGDDVSLQGHITVTGDVYAAGDDGNIGITGNGNNMTIAGSSDPDVYASHLHENIPIPEFPELDLAPLTALATTLYEDDGNNGGGGRGGGGGGEPLVLNNVYIPANTDPQFAQDTTINGILYIQSPNDVVFKSQVTINGMIVTDPTDTDSTLTFKGHMTANSVENAPEDPMFDDIKEHVGAFILAPGYDLDFHGHVTATGGVIVADSLEFHGHPVVTTSSIIGLSDNASALWGNVNINIDKTDLPPSIAGFENTLALEVDRGSYQEVAE